MQPPAVSDRTQHIPEGLVLAQLDRCYSAQLSSSTATIASGAYRQQPAPVWKERSSTALHERFTTCHAHALARHTFVTTTHTRNVFVCGGRQNAVVILRNLPLTASRMSNTANCCGFSYHTQHHLLTGSPLRSENCLDFSTADDMWVLLPMLNTSLHVPVRFTSKICGLLSYSACFLSGVCAETCPLPFAVVPA